jgi:general secretion pathway protein D
MTRTLVALVTAASVLVLAGCATSALRQAQVADDLRDYDLAVARYTQAVRERPSDRDAALGLERAKLRASQEHLVHGRRLFAQGRYDDAVVELQIATELNPGNAAATAELRAVRLALRTQLARPADGETPLQSLLSRTTDLAPAGLELPNTALPTQINAGAQATARSVFLLLGRLTNLSVTFDSQFRDVPAPVNLRAGMTTREAFDAVTAATGTFYQVTAPGTIVVAPDTPAKRREYVDEVVRQFTVQNVDLKETIDALRVVADVRYISPLTGTNTFLVRDTPERVQVVGKFLAAFDKAKPEVVVTVEVLEVDRLRLREYGLQIASPGSTGISGNLDANREDLTLDNIRTLSRADIPLTNLPALYYRLLKTDTRTRTLANPHLRATDGSTAVARFGQEVPVPRVTIAPITQGGVNIQPQTQFDYRNVGVNITVTPRTHPNDDVTLALNIELSSVGAPGFDGLPTFGSRNVTTTIRLRDGETSILAGLIREDERTERQTIPGIGDIPVLGNLFSQNRRVAQQTDVVIMLTPNVVRVLDLTEGDLRPLRLPREGTGGVILEPGPIIVPGPLTTPSTTPQGPIIVPAPPPPTPARPTP